MGLIGFFKLGLIGFFKLGLMGFFKLGLIGFIEFIGFKVFLLGCHTIFGEEKGPSIVNYPCSRGICARRGPCRTIQPWHWDAVLDQDPG